MITVTVTIKDDGNALIFKTGRVDFPDDPATPHEVKIAKMVCGHFDAFPAEFAKQTGAHLLAMQMPKQADGN